LNINRITNLLSPAACAACAAPEAIPLAVTLVLLTLDMSTVDDRQEGVNVEESKSDVLQGTLDLMVLKPRFIGGRCLGRG